MRWLKVSALAILWLFFFIFTSLIHLIGSVFGLAGRWKLASRLSHYFASLMRGILNIKITLEGHRETLNCGGHFIVSNHLSYVDGIVLGSLFPMIYVSKSEVRQWRWIGQWTALTGTIFVDRQRKNKVLHVVEEITAKLNEKAHVLVFPEGTSSNGEILLPFQTAFFAAPLAAGAAIVPVTLTYKRINQEPLSRANRDQVYWYGGRDFVSHVWGLLGLRRIEVSVKIHPKIETAHYKNNSLSRKQLSQACYDSVSGETNLKNQSCRRRDPIGSI